MLRFQENSTYSDNPGIIEEETHQCMHNGPIILNKIEFQRNGEKNVPADKSKQNASVGDAVRRDFKIVYD